MNNLKTMVLSVIAVWIIKILSFTHKINYFGLENVEFIKKQNKNIVFVFWHGRQFILVNSHKNRGICIMASLSKDGDLQAKILTKLGYFIVRGSSSKGGAQALVEMIRAMRDGRDVAFAGDGPRGPIYELKPGPIYLAQKTQSAIIPVAVSAQDKWILKNWDKYLIPKPFTKTFVEYGQPIFINEDVDINEQVRNLSNILNTMRKNLDEKVGK